MRGGLSTQVKMNVKPIGAFKSYLIRQVVFERRGLVQDTRTSQLINIWHGERAI